MFLPHTEREQSAAGGFGFGREVYQHNSTADAVDLWQLK